jgi:hypothetical protein
MVGIAFEAYRDGPDLMLNARRAQTRLNFLPNVIEEKQCFPVDVRGLDAVAHEGDKVFEAAGIVMPTACFVMVGRARVVKAAFGFGGLAVGQKNNFLIALSLGFHHKLVEVALV